MLIKHNANFWWLTVPVASILSQDSLTWVKSTKVRQISQKIEKKKTEANSYLLFFWSFCLQSFYLNVVPFSSVIAKDKVNSTWSHNCSAIHTPHFILQPANSFIFLPRRVEDHRASCGKSQQRQCSLNLAYAQWIYSQSLMTQPAAGSSVLGPEKSVCLLELSV